MIDRMRADLEARSNERLHLRPNHMVANRRAWRHPGVILALFGCAADKPGGDEENPSHASFSQDRQGIAVNTLKPIVERDDNRMLGWLSRSILVCQIVVKIHRSIA